MAQQRDRDLGRDGDGGGVDELPGLRSQFLLTSACELIMHFLASG